MEQVRFISVKEMSLPELVQFWDHHIKDGYIYAGDMHKYFTSKNQVPEAIELDSSEDTVNIAREYLIKEYASIYAFVGGKYIPNFQEWLFKMEEDLQKENMQYLCFSQEEVPFLEGDNPQCIMYYPRLNRLVYELQVQLCGKPLREVVRLTLEEYESLVKKGEKTVSRAEHSIDIMGRHRHTPLIHSQLV
jgi:hypothetical protein